MTARSWQREAEPGWRWAPSPVRFWYGPGGEGAIADELLGGVDPARVRAVMLRLDVTETERCANGGGLAFAATDEHREIIARTGRIPIRAEHRYRLDTLVAWLTERLIAVGLARDRIRTELNPLIDVGDAPAETLLRPNVELVFLVRVGGR